MSWVRHNDVGLISVGKFQYIRDPRFKIVHAPRSQEWLLVIRAVRFGDEGPYECQVNTSPIRRETVYLTVVGKLDSPRHPSVLRELSYGLHFICNSELNMTKRTTARSKQRQPS